MSFIKEDFELQLNKQLVLDTVSIWPACCHLHFRPGAWRPGPEHPEPRAEARTWRSAPRGFLWASQGRSFSRTGGSCSLRKGSGPLTPSHRAVGCAFLTVVRVKELCWRKPPPPPLSLLEKPGAFTLVGWVSRALGASSNVCFQSFTHFDLVPPDTQE